MDVSTRILPPLALLAVVGLASACATPAQWAEWRQHSSHFASAEHLGFSVGHQGPAPTAPVTRRHLDRARAEAWWGEPIVVRPEQVVELPPSDR